MPSPPAGPRASGGRSGAPAAQCRASIGEPTNDLMATSSGVFDKAATTAGTPGPWTPAAAGPRPPHARKNSARKGRWDCRPIRPRPQQGRRRGQPSAPRHGDVQRCHRPTPVTRPARSAGRARPSSKAKNAANFATAHIGPALNPRAGTGPIRDPRERAGRPGVHPPRRDQQLAVSRQRPAAATPALARASRPRPLRIVLVAASVVELFQNRLLEAVQ